MTVLITADWHLSDNPRDAYRHAFIRTLPAIVKKNGVKTVIVLGDLTAEKDRHGAWLVNEVAGAIHRLAREGIVIILRGNHDYTDEAHPFFGFLNYIDNVFWIGTTTSRVIGNGQECLFLPHTTNYKKDWKRWINDYAMTFAHNTFTGADAGHGRRLDGIPIEALPKGTTISGDVHVPQTIRGTGREVIYVGPPYTINYGDEYGPRMLMWRSARGGVEQLNDFICDGPRKRLIEVGKVSELRKLHGGYLVGDMVKVRVRLQPSDHAAWPEIQDDVRKWADSNEYVLHTVQPVMITDEADRVQKRKRSAPTKSDEQLMKEYAKVRDIDEHTLKTGYWLMEKQ